MSNQEDDVFGAALFGIMLGAIIAIFIFVMTDDNVKMVNYDDGTVAVCEGSKTLVVREDGEWYAPEGLSVHLCD